MNKKNSGKNQRKHDRWVDDGFEDPFGGFMEEFDFHSGFNDDFFGGFGSLARRFDDFHSGMFSK